ncbi:MAG TPA: trigger factor [Drouetiella sp.]|jgi:trigger factor
MKVTLDREGKNLVRMGLELESEKALKAYEMACRSLSHQVNIPGFRRGKAPRNIIEKTLGVDYIKREALEKLVPELLSRAIMDESLDVITEPQIDSCEFELGSPLKLNANFEVRPEVTLGTYTGVSVDVPEATLPADAMDRALASIAESKASLQAAPARKVAKGDTVLLDFECFVDGKLVEGGKAEGLVLEVKEGTFIEGFCDQLIDKEPGQQFEVNVKFPEEYRNKELANKDANFKVDLKELRERVTPEINDELAVSIGQPSLQALKDALQERLNEEVRQENEMRSQRSVVEAVVKAATVDIPESMVERERDLLLQQVRRYLEQNNQNWDEFQQSPDFEQVRANKLEEARQRVLTSLVLGAVVRAEKMSVDDDEIAPYLAEIVARYDLQADQVARNEELRRQVMEEVLTNKVVQFLLGKANIKFVEEPEHDHSHEHGHEHHHHKEGEACEHEHGEQSEGKKSKKKESEKSAQKS